MEFNKIGVEDFYGQQRGETGKSFDRRSRIDPRNTVSLYKALPVINVLGRGATGDGSTDDFGAISAAFEDAREMGGARIWFPYGTYVLSDDLPIYDNLWLDGEIGATLQVADSGHLGSERILYASASFGGSLLITNITFDQRSDVYDEQSSSPCVTLAESDTANSFARVTFFNVRFYRTITRAIHADVVSGQTGKDLKILGCSFEDNRMVAIGLNGAITDLVVDDCSFEKIGDDAIAIQNNADATSPYMRRATVSNCVMNDVDSTYGGAGNGIRIYNCDDVAVVNTEMYNIGGAGIAVQYSTGDRGRTPARIQIIGNGIYSAGQNSGIRHGILVQGGDSVKVVGNDVYDAYTHGIYVYPAVADTEIRNITIANNHCISNGGDGILVYANSGNIYDVGILGNVCMNNGQSGGSTDAGIYIRSTDATYYIDGVRIGWNRCGDYQDTKTQEYGIYFQGSPNTKNVMLGYNDLRGNGHASLPGIAYDSTQPTPMIFVDNLDSCPASGAGGGVLNADGAGGNKILFQKDLTTSNATSTNIWAMALDDESTYKIKADVTAIQADGSERAGYELSCVAYRDAEGSATFQAMASCTGTTETSGTDDNVDGVDNCSDFKVGDGVLCSAGFPSATTVYVITAKDDADSGADNGIIWTDTTPNADETAVTITKVVDGKFLCESDTAWKCTFQVTGNNITLTVMGDSGNDVHWLAEIEYKKLSGTA